MNALKKSTRGLAVTLALLVLSAAAAQAQTTPITFDFMPAAPTDVNINTGIRLDLNVYLPAGDYQGLVVKLDLPDRVGLTGSASPVNAQFDNASVVAGDVVWNQQLPIDLTAGAAVRQFTAFLSTTELAGYVREGATANFVVTISGDHSDTVGGLYAPVNTVPLTHTVTWHGAANLGWNTYSIGALRGYLSTEATPRTGVKRKLSFYAWNNGSALLDGPISIEANFGSGYTFISATRRSNPTPVDSSPTPWSAGPGTVQMTTDGANLSGFLDVELFIPCTAFGKTAEESAAQGDAYRVSASATATQLHQDGSVIEAFELTGAASGPLDLTQSCGEGGGLTKSVYAITRGIDVPWEMDLAPPFGVTVVENAMLVDILPPETREVVAWDGPSSENPAVFTRWLCNFSAFPAGHFDSTEFLARRDANCRSGYGSFQVGDTHLVHFAEAWGSDDAVLAPVTFRVITRMDYAWVVANPGATIENTAYFNGDLDVFEDLGDTVPEVGTEDPWEAKRVSPGMMSTSTWSLDVSRRNSFNTGVAPSSIDANAGTARVLVNLLYANGLNIQNPVVSMTYPEGIILDGVRGPGYGSWTTGSTCEGPGADHEMGPGAGPWASPLSWSAGDTTVPYVLGPTQVTGCSNMWGELSFTVDRNYPWIDGEVMAFDATGNVDGGAQKTAATNFVVRVSTGMDVLLDGACWTDASAIAPPEQGLQLFKATAVNRGSNDLGGLELRFIIPQDAVYRTALPGPDFPVDGIIEVSRDGGITWAAAPTGADPTVTDVRVTDLEILGLGLAAPRPSFYVGLLADTPSALVTGGAWIRTDMYQLGQTPTKEVVVDASECAVPCTCPDPTPNDTCSTGGCNAQGDCIQVNEEDQASCQFQGDLCVTAAACSAGVCTATATTSCGDENTCTNDSCDPETGLCGYRPVFDCTDKRPFYLPVSKDNKVVGAVLCWVVLEGGRETVRCDAEGDRLNLHEEHSRACGN